MQHISEDKAQSSMELIIISMLILVLTTGMIKTTIQINKGNASIAIIKAHALEAMEKEPELYIIEDVVPENISGGQSIANIKMEIEPTPTVGFFPPGICNGVEKGRSAVEEAFIYDEVIMSGSVDGKCP